MLSVQTNYASMMAQSSVNNNNNMLSTAMERLSTGLRINHSSDDAAGLQIADRLNMNVIGMNTAKRNISDTVSMLQAADGGLDELTKIASRQKELATQAANGVNNDDDTKAMSEEFQALTQESARILKHTDYAGQNLFEALSGKTMKADGTFDKSTTHSDGTTFQIGASKEETLTVKADVTDLSLKKLQEATGLADNEKNTASTAKIGNATIEVVDNFAKAIDAVRGALGATSNRLLHTSSNLTNVSEKTRAGYGRIMDADFATESAAMTKNQLLVQAGTKVLSHANQNTGLVMGLLG